MDINTNLTAIKGIGEKTAGLFSKLHIGTVGQLLEHYPRDYERMEPAVTVSALSPGKVCAVKASVIGMPSTKRVRNLLITAVQAGDATGLFRITFFGMPLSLIHIFLFLRATRHQVFAQILINKNG